MAAVRSHWGAGQGQLLPTPLVGRLQLVGRPGRLGRVDRRFLGMARVVARLLVHLRMWDLMVVD